PRGVDVVDAVAQRLADAWVEGLVEARAAAEQQDWDLLARLAQGAPRHLGLGRPRLERREQRSHQPRRSGAAERQQVTTSLIDGFGVMAHDELLGSRLVVLL